MAVDARLVDRVVRVVELNTTRDQPPALPEHTVLLILVVHAGEDVDDVRAALVEAVDQGRLEETRDGYRVVE